MARSTNSGGLAVAKSRPRWSPSSEFGYVYLWDNSIIGTVDKSPNQYWYAYGCEDDWQDVRLGAHDTEREAKKAVESWVKENIS
jgi:hypothetical protein